MTEENYEAPTPRTHEAFRLVYKALSDLETGVRIAGARTTYDPPETSPLVGLAALLGLPEHVQWERGK